MFDDMVTILPGRGLAPPETATPETATAKAAATMASLKLAAS
jgi:hypothetical protein